MGRPNVYQRSAPRARRNVIREATVDYVPAARAVLMAAPDFLRQAEAAGTVVLSALSRAGAERGRGDHEAGRAVGVSASKPRPSRPEATVHFRSTVPRTLAGCNGYQYLMTTEATLRHPVLRVLKG